MSNPPSWLRCETCIWWSESDQVCHGQWAAGPGGAERPAPTASDYCALWTDRWPIPTQETLDKEKEEE